MAFLENDLEEIIFNSDPNELSKRGLWVLEDHYHLVRQPYLNEAGRADLIGFRIETPRSGIKQTRRIEIVIFELKRDIIDTQTVLQALRYRDKIDDHIQHTRNTEFRISIVLIGRTINQSGDLIPLLTALGDTISLYTYTYNLDGIGFQQKSINRRVVDSEFGVNKRIRAYAKALFSDEVKRFSPVKTREEVKNLLSQPLPFEDGNEDGGIF